jgi:hypothetical protein
LIGADLLLRVGQTSAPKTVPKKSKVPAQNLLLALFVEGCAEIHCDECTGANGAPSASKYDACARIDVHD